ncbi:hypothetical protein PNOK_0833400 [Pyrrhoderma noxium]|uniref:Uncharacterized protein n=1 Tax=Pyrrhoderma noxium TaxID=2282107 RepID=A0A286UB14_9AGAM|nr:hypothetical protein PNOK_0833400 [Pyrrhoderma noxium]
MGAFFQAHQHRKHIYLKTPRPFLVAEELIEPSFNLTLLDDQPQDSNGDYIQCSQVSFRISSYNTTTPSVVPPFFMIETEENGATSTTPLGSKTNELDWPVKHPKGSTVFFHVIDSEGHTSVAYSNDISKSGGTTDCLISSTSSNFTVSFNKQQVNECDTVMLNMTGGTKPFTVMVIGERISNYTLGDSDDVFLFTNYIRSGDTYQMAVADSAGQWASGPNTINSVGSSNSSCLGESYGTHSSGSSDSESSQAPSSKSPTTSSSSSVNVAAIAGGIAGGVAILCLIAAIIIGCHFKRRKQELSDTNRYRDGSSYVTGKNTNKNSQYTPISFELSGVATKPAVDDNAEIPLLRDESGGDDLNSRQATAFSTTEKASFREVSVSISVNTISPCIVLSL